MKLEFENQISEYNISITEKDNGYIFEAQKRIMLIKFFVKAEITADDGQFTIEWKTNAPETSVNEAIEKTKEILEKC